MKNDITEQERVVDDGIYQETPSGTYVPAKPLEDRFARASTKYGVVALLVVAVLFTLFWIVPTVVNLRVPGVAFLATAAAVIGAATPIYFIIKILRK